ARWGSTFESKVADTGGELSQLAIDSSELAAGDGARNIVYRALSSDEAATVRAGEGIARPVSSVPPVAHINNFNGVSERTPFTSVTRSLDTARRFALGRNPGARAASPIIAIDLDRVTLPVVDVSTRAAAEAVLGTKSSAARNAVELATRAEELLV